ESQPVPQEEHPAEPAASAEAGAYPDHQPPVDDFSDSEPHAQGALAPTEETDLASEEAAATPSRSKGTLVLLAIAGVVVLGALAYWSFGHSSSAPSSDQIAMT